MLINATVSGLNGALEETASASSASYSGTTFTLDASYPVGSFANTGFPNHLFVVAASGITLTATSPASSDDVNGRLRDGVMVNPDLSGAVSQGWDELLAVPTRGIAYSEALNLDPSKPGGSSQAISANSSIVKWRRNAGQTETSYDMFEGGEILHVLATTPALNSYPPSYTATTKRMFSRANVDLTKLRSLTMPGTFTAPTTIFSYLPQDCAEFGAERGDPYRYLRQDTAVNPNAASNYSGDYTDWYGRAMMALHDSSISAALRQQIMDRLIGWGIQIQGLIADGGNLGGGAGQGGGYGSAYIAALLLNDVTYLTNAKALDGQLHSTKWATSEKIGSGGQTVSGVNMQPYFDEHLDIPLVTPEGQNTNHDSRYFDSGTRNTIWEAFGISMLQAGTGTSGLAALLDGATQNDTASQRASIISYMSRVRQMDAWRLPRNPGAEWQDIWDAFYTTVGITPWTGQPDQMPSDDDGTNNFFSAGIGAVSWDISAYDYATETVTDIEVRYAIDNGYAPVQFVAETGKTSTGSITGLLRGQSHWCQIRKVSASGSGAWSASYPRTGAMDGTAGRDTIATTGTATAVIPANTTAPTIHVKQYPAWEFPTWKVAPSTLGVDDVELACGLGYWSGYPAPTFAYQWKRDGVNISGATAQTYARTTADASVVITCEITATNSEGEASVTTASVTAPTLTTLPAGTLIDTNFKSGFALDYDTEIAGVITSGSTFSHEPYQSLEAVDGLNVGIVRANKTSSNPYIDFPLQSAAVAGTTYNLVAGLATAWNFENSADYFGGTYEFSIRNGSAEIFYSTTFEPTVLPGGVVERFDVSTTFPVGGGITDLDLYFRIRNSIGAGGTSLGEPAISNITISAV